ncbi:hypothetical protein ACFLSJ_05195, partial [Verrucomicrobiota bacterium]
KSLELPDGAPGRLVVGGRYAVKILVPPSRFSAGFRNLVYWIAFQSRFTPQTNEAACRVGLLWPKLVRVAAARELGDADAVADTYASFYDAPMRAYGEVREWVEGRTWRLEADSHIRERAKWRSVDPAQTGSPEYVAKRRFMARLVNMLHDMGMPELARQYEWWTLKSQPNVLKRAGRDRGPAEGLCAVDFRAGLALVPCLPMSPGDVPLILAGLRRGSLAQFDRCDWDKLRAYVAAHSETFEGYGDLIDALQAYDRRYRRAMPDLTHQCLGLMRDSDLRRDVVGGLVDGYFAADLVDEAFAERLRQGGARFAAFYLLGAAPLAGRVVRRLWGHAARRRHLFRMLTSFSYLRDVGRARANAAALRWHRNGRVGERHARLVADHVWLFWLERLTLGLLPIGKLHRFLAEPAWWLHGVRDGWRYVQRFLKDGAFREQWLREQVEDGSREGMLGDEEKSVILAHIRDPFIAKYLKSVGVHLATLPVTQVVSVAVGGIWAARILASGGSGQAAGAAFVGTVAFFQVIPISPGSICRGCYVVYLMVRERNWRDYVVAAPLAFLKYVGYLSFPLQMTATYPELAQFMAGRWATNAVHVVPVFGERGALLEHWVFDICFNVSRAVGRWALRHVRGTLDVWLLVGTAGLATLLGLRGIDWTEMSGIKFGVNAILLYVGAFLLPRVLIYPVLRGRTGKRSDPKAD